MPRRARIVVPGYPLHITQRGNYGQRVFEDDKDRRTYLRWVDRYSKEYGLLHLGYCLMSNHVHFISIPQNEDSVSNVFRIVHMRYSNYFNRKKETYGHLWQGRFYSCLLDDEHLQIALKYVERNPVRSGFVKKPWEWKWSSAKDNSGSRKGLVELEDISTHVDLDGNKWKEHLDNGDKVGDLQKIRNHTSRGFPLGSRKFLDKVGRIIGEKLEQNPR